MEFNEKLQELRKQKGLTQEALAECLYVSRTAISKWESGRGYPNIDSLKAIAKYFSVTIDDLLSSGEMLSIAEEEHMQKEMQFRDLVFGLLDCSMALFLFLPLFGQNIDGTIEDVSLFNLTAIQPYLKTAFFIAVISMALWGILTLALQNWHCAFWVRNKNRLSVNLGVAAVCLFIMSQQPYAAVFTFAFLIIKVLMLLKRK